MSIRSSRSGRNRRGCGSRGNDAQVIRVGVSKPTWSSGCDGIARSGLISRCVMPLVLGQQRINCPRRRCQRAPRVPWRSSTLGRRIPTIPRKDFPSRLNTWPASREGEWRSPGRPRQRGRVQTSYMSLHHSVARKHTSIRSGIRRPPLRPVSLDLPRLLSRSHRLVDIEEPRLGGS